MASRIEKNKAFQVCPECTGMVIAIPERGEAVCEDCGLVVDERLVDSTHSGKRAFTQQERDNRESTGAPVSSMMPHIGLSTVIDKSKIESPDLKRASKWDTRMSWNTRNLLIASTELKRISTNLTLPNHVKENAFQVYKEAFKNGLLRGRSINGMVAACLYFAIRKDSIPVTLDEVLEHTTSSGKDVKKCYYTLIKELNKKLPSQDPVNLIPRYIAELGLDSEIEQLATRIINKYRSIRSISGKDPKGLVAGAIYVACKLKKIPLTQKGIAISLGVTEVTLRSRFKELTQTLNITE